MLLLLLLSRFSHIRLCDPVVGSPPGSAVPGILRQESWSGLPLPSPGRGMAVGIRQCFWACGRDPQAMQVAMRPGGRCCPEDQR